MTELLAQRAILAEQLQALALELLALESPGPDQSVASALTGQLQQLAQQATLVGAKGLPELLRLLAAGVRDRANQRSSSSAEGVAELVLWCQHAAALQQGLVPPYEVSILVTLFAGVDWIPPIIPRMHEVLVIRLSEEAERLQAAAAEAVPDDRNLLVETADALLDAADLPAVEARSDLLPELPSVGNELPIDRLLVDDGVVFETPTENWISPDEMALAVTALSEQLLPQLDQLSQNRQADLQPGLADEFHFQFSLVLNALEHLNLRAVQLAGDAVQTELAVLREQDPFAARPALERISNWLVCLLGWFHTEADPAMAEAFVETLADPGWLLVADADAQAAVLAEMLSVKVGRDPSLVVSLKTAVEPGDVDLNMAADVAASVRDGMLRELPRNCEQLRLALTAACATGDATAIDDARRYAHTLKGDANTVGVRGIANLTHALEDILVALARAPLVPAPDVSELLISTADCVEAMSDHLLGRGTPPDDALAIYQHVLTLANHVLAGERELGSTDSAAPALPAEPAGAESVAPTAADSSEDSIRSLQIPVPVLDELLRLSSETIVLARQVEEQLRQITLAQNDLDLQNRQSRDLVSQLDDLVALRGAALQSTRLQREREVDALEMDQYNELHVVSRRLIETSSDTNAHLLSLDRALSQVRDLSAQQDRVHLALQQSVLNTRSVPFATQVSRFQRVVRQTARQLGKDASLQVQGEQTLIDADILEQIAEPLVHALRNAVDHGLEATEVREAAGKPAQGLLQLDVRRQAGDILISLRDDGAGFDLDAIRRVALARGLIGPDAVLSPEQQLQLVLLPGFSTRAQATQISGRGMGMDVLARRVRELRGSLQLRSTPGQGASLELVLPASLNAAHVALARTRDGVVAAVSGSIQRFVPLRPEDYDLDEAGRLHVLIDGNPLPAITLDALCNAGSGRDALEQSAIGLIVQDASGQSIVVVTRQVDELREVIVKSLGVYVAPISGLRGTTILGNGGLAPVVDLGLLLASQQEAGFAAWSALETERRASVLIVDDSLSVRRALASLMQDAGFEVVTARDGLEALDQFSKGLRPVCILLDLEMPRMNGLELTRYVRNAESLRETPIIMITSRTADRHRELAEDAGVTELLGKPFQDDALVQLVERLTLPASSIDSI